MEDITRAEHAQAARAGAAGAEQAAAPERAHRPVERQRERARREHGEGGLLDGERRAVRVDERQVRLRRRVGDRRHVGGRSAAGLLRFAGGRVELPVQHAVGNVHLRRQPRGVDGPGGAGGCRRREQRTSFGCVYL